MGIVAAGQGAVGVEIRKNDQRLRDYLNPLHCHETAAAVAAETREGREAE